MRSMSRGAILMHSHWQIAAGLIVGLVLIPPLHIEYSAWQERREAEAQRARPVVTSTARVVGRTDFYVDLHLTGEKHRECDILAVIGYRVARGQVASDFADAYRIDRLGRNTTRPIGPWDGGIWRLWVGRDERGWLEVRHSCGGVVVQTILARVPASEPAADPALEP